MSSSDTTRPSGKARPRLEPVDPAAANQAQAALLEPLGGPEAKNLFRTLAHNPELTKAWLRFGGHLLMRSSLPDRERELVILRVAFLCGSDYEWGQHLEIAHDAGVTAEEILRVVEGPLHGDWGSRDAALLQATDELVTDHDLSDEAWEQLSGVLDDPGVIELTLLVGHYAMLAGTLRALRVQTESPMPTVGRL